MCLLCITRKFLLKGEVWGKLYNFVIRFIEAKHFNLFGLWVLCSRWAGISMRPTPTPLLPLLLLHHLVLYWWSIGGLLVLYCCTILCSIGGRLFCLPPSFGNWFSDRQVDHLFELVQCNVDTNNILAQRWIDKLVFTCTDLIAVEPQWRWVGCVPRPLTSSIKRFRQYRPGDARPSLVWVFGIWGPYTVVAPHQAYQGPSNTALSNSEGIVVLSKWSVPKSQ